MLQSSSNAATTDIQYKMMNVRKYRTTAAVAAVGVAILFLSLTIQ